MKSSRAELCCAIGLVLALLLGGCAATRPLSEADGGDVDSQLRQSLDRWAGWKSFSAKVKLTVSLGDTTLRARGHLIYMLGERYELGFRRPYNRVLGNFYVVPDRVIYWDPRGTPRVFTGEDSITLSDMMAIALPNWDVRDLLPFPVSGRSSGFRADSVVSRGDFTSVAGSSDGVEYTLELSRAAGGVIRERVDRLSREPLFKRYEKARTMDGWRIPRRVTCEDQTRRYRLTWSLSSITLDAQPFQLSREQLHPAEGNHGR